MAVHYCPECREFSYHGPGYAPWAMECPHCGLIARQEPHPLPPKPKQASKPKAKAKAKGSEAPQEEASE